MAEYRKIIVWFLACLLLAVYAKMSNYLPSPAGSGSILGKSTVSTNPGFGPLLHQNK